MATTSNGDSSNGNGGGVPPTRARLYALLAHHQRVVDALKLTLQLLYDEAAIKKTKAATSVIAKAVALDSHRRRKGSYVKARSKKRSDTAALLKRFDTTEARSFNGEMKRWAVGTLVRHGYLKPKGDGYIRTAKEFAP